jgi:nicotinamidase-related amidase
MPELEIHKKTTGLVVIDLQKGIAAQTTQPYPAHEVIKNAAQLVKAFRNNGMPVFLVHVVAAPETMLKVNSDETFSRSGPMPPAWSEFVPEIAPGSSDIVIAKRQWGAFYGTDLELQLRRRGLDTIVLCGIATDFGVESTARFAYELGYAQVFAEDAMACRSVAEHNATVSVIFPRMGCVRSTADILAALQ